MKRLLQRFSVRTRPKLLAILGAILLYYYVKNLKITEITLNVPLVLTHRPPAGLALVTELPRFVSITIAGKEEALKFSTANLRAELNLSNATTEPQYYPIEFDEKQLPESVLLRKKPAPLELKFEKVLRRRLPVKVVLSGNPDSAHRLARVATYPESVLVEAAESSFKTMKEIMTTPLSIEGVTATFSRRLRLQSPTPVIALEPTEVEVMVSVIATATSGERQFDAIPIRLLNLDPALEAILSDKSVQVILSGDREALKRLSPADVSATVDVSETRYNPATGSILPYEVEQGLQVKVKLLRNVKNVSLISFSPENVSVRFRVKEEYKKEENPLEGKNP